MNIKKLSRFFIRSKTNQQIDIKIIKEKGIHKIFLLKEEMMSPLKRKIVARPMPQPGQGMPVANLKRQTVLC
jgi:hypothetical protein